MSSPSFNDAGRVLAYGRGVRGWGWRRGLVVAFLTTVVLAVSGVMILGLLAPRNRLVCFHYPRVVKKNQLLLPVTITAAGADTITLSDGRVFRVDTVCDDPWGNPYRLTPGKAIDVNAVGSGGFVAYGDESQWVCGTPWTGMIEIPLLADDVPDTSRKMIALLDGLPATRSAAAQAVP